MASSYGDSAHLIFESRHKMLKLAPIGVGFVVLGWALIFVETFSEGRRGAAAPFVGVLTIALFGPIALWTIWRVVVAGRSPVLVLTDDGFHDLTLTGGTFIHWSEVSFIGIITIHKNQVVTGRVTNPDGLHAQRSGLRRLLGRANRRFGDFAFSEAGLSLTAKELEALMVDRWSANGKTSTSEH